MQLQLQHQFKHFLFCGVPFYVITLYIDSTLWHGSDLHKPPPPPPPPQCDVPLNVLHALYSDMPKLKMNVY